ncbi:hypothetical protein [Benzoatithermus flavus]|uniref:Uncharacterized protein n=1 Tax=Benzoatithermus flavus TaxID=3108223 RepID=A0ABU8XV68_9PROT
MTAEAAKVLTNSDTLLSGSGVMSTSGHQDGDELAEEGFAATASVVHEPEEGEVERQLLRRETAMRPQPTSAAATRPLPWC